MIRSLLGFTITLSLFVSSARSEIYSMYTFPAPGGPGRKSEIDFLIAVTLNGESRRVQTPLLELTGTATVDMKLDSNDDGPIRNFRSLFSLENFRSTLLTSVGPVPYSFNGVEAVLRFNSAASRIGGRIFISVSSDYVFELTAGTFTIEAPTGNIVIDFAADNAEFRPVIDFSADAFGGLADDSSSKGFDTIDSNPHNLGAPGLTGLSEIDDDGTELAFDFLSDADSYVNLGPSGNDAVTFFINPSRLSMIVVGVPEVSSLILLALAGIGWALFRFPLVGHERRIP